MSAGDDELVMARARESFAEVAADVVELRARRLCREAEPHGEGRVPCLPTVAEFVGSDPGFTGGLSAEEYVREGRDG